MLLRSTGPARHTTDRGDPDRRTDATTAESAEIGERMFITNHVFAGAIAGTVCKRRPVRAFVVGFATHVVMDMTPHWGNANLDRDGFYAVAKRDGLLGLAALSIITVAGVPPRTALLAGMAGASILDSDKPGEYFFGVNPLPDRLDRFHKEIQRESPEGMRVEVPAGLALAAVAAAFLARARRQSRARAAP
jgi:hypothetical protein